MPVASVNNLKTQFAPICYLLKSNMNLKKLLSRKMLMRKKAMMQASQQKRGGRQCRSGRASAAGTSWARSSQLSHSLSQHGVTGREWTHTQSNVCPLSKSQHWETFNIHIIWVSEKFRTFYPLLQSTHICRAKELIVNQFCGLKLTVWIMKINIAFILMYSHCAITF